MTQNCMKQMMAVVNKKGKGITPEKLLKKFQKLGYYGVSLQDCSTVLFIIRKGIKDPSLNRFLLLERYKKNIVV